MSGERHEPVEAGGWQARRSAERADEDDGLLVEARRIVLRRLGLRVAAGVLALVGLGAPAAWLSETASEGLAEIEALRRVVAELRAVELERERKLDRLDAAIRDLAVEAAVRRAVDRRLPGRSLAPEEARDVIDLMAAREAVVREATRCLGGDRSLAEGAFDRVVEQRSKGR